MQIRLKIPPLTKTIIAILAILVLGAVGGYFYRGKKASNTIPVTKTQTNKYVAFEMEVYDKIKENYWEKLDDEVLVKTFVLGIEKLTGQTQHLKKEDRENLEKTLEEIVKLYDNDDKRKQFATELADIVLANLKPFNRSRLYVKRDEIALQNNVSNKTETDHYQELGIDKTASVDQIEQVAKEKLKNLKPLKDSSPEAKKKYEAVVKAQKILTDQDAKKSYDAASIEPTMDYRLISPEIFYMHLTKFSPTTLEELQRVTEKVDKGDQLDTLIWDLRDNVGGAIDGLPYFLGPFIGNDQYAYQFLRQGEKEDYKTKIGWMPSLIRYKKVVILINENAQSTAEVMAATLKKYNVGVLIGTKTRGWGTVEKVFKLNNQIDSNEEYSVFLVHSLTLREDGQPIEGNGVEPVIDIKDPAWEQKLRRQFNSEKIVEAVKEVLKK